MFPKSIVKEWYHDFSSGLSETTKYIIFVLHCYLLSGNIWENSKHYIWPTEVVIMRVNPSFFLRMLPGWMIIYKDTTPFDSSTLV